MSLNPELEKQIRFQCDTDSYMIYQSFDPRDILELLREIDRLREEIKALKEK